MELFILIWLLIGLSLLVGVVGKDRKIGFGMSFLWAILLSPLIGLVIALLSDKKKKEQEYYSSHSSYRNHDEDNENRYRTSIADRKTNTNDKKTPISEWKERNPHKSINDYYREIGKQ